MLYLHRSSLNRWDAVKDSPEVSNSKTTQYNLPKCRRCGRCFHVMKRQELWAQAESDEQPDILGKFLIGFSSSHAFCLMCQVDFKHRMPDWSADSQWWPSGTRWKDLWMFSLDTLNLLFCSGFLQDFRKSSDTHSLRHCVCLLALCKGI